LRTADMVKSKFFRARDVEGQPPMVLTIADVTEELMGRGGRQEVKCFLWFHETPKGLQLNKSRVNVLETAYGPDSDLWSGKKVRIYFDPKVEFGGRPVGGVGIQTPPGAIFRGTPNAAAWGDAPHPQTPAGAPPPPVWDGTKWVVQQPAPAAAAPARPPPPVWNATSQAWETVNPQTGEISAPAAPVHQRPPTISERVNAGHPPTTDGGWGALTPTSDPTSAAPAAPEFDDDIPF